MQPDATISETYQSAPRQSNAANWAAILLGVVAVFLCLALAGAGYWGYTQSSQLKDTQAELAKWKSDYETLKNEKNTLATNLTQTTSELDSVKAELVKARTDLANSQNEVTALQRKIDLTLTFLNVFDNFWDDTVSTSEAKINLTGDDQLLAKYKTWVDGGFKNAQYYEFFDYFVATVIGNLK